MESAAAAQKAASPLPEKVDKLEALSIELGMDKLERGGQSLPSTNLPAPAAQQAIKKVNYTHDAMIDLIIQNPGINQGLLATHFGYTQGWISRVLACDAFQQQLASRKSELVDPMIVATLEERFKALVQRSIDVVLEKLDNKAVSADVALKGVELGAKALGYGAKPNGPQIQQNFIAVVPAKSKDAVEWIKDHAIAGAVKLAPIIETREALLTTGG